MKPILIFILSFLFSVAQAKKEVPRQPEINFKEIRKYTETIDAEYSSKPKVLAALLSKPYHTEVEKVAAIYCWIASNIKYSAAIKDDEFDYGSSEDELKGLMKDRIGVCRNFADFFVLLCEEMGIDAFYVSGFTSAKEDGSTAGHAWNAVKADGNWYGVDVTYAAGPLMGSQFFAERFSPDYCLVYPSEFIKSHMPYDIMWQMLEHPYPFDDFYSQKFENPGAFFSFPDSIVAYSHRSYCQNVEDRIKRIEANGSANRKIINLLMHLYRILDSCKH